MKNMALLFLGIPIALASCNNSAKDSVEKADSANVAKSDTGNKSTDPTMKTGMDESTAHFMVEAANGGMTEVELGKLAEKKAASGRVKNFGSMMVTDHSRVGEELKSL